MNLTSVRDILNGSASVSLWRTVVLGIVHLVISIEVNLPLRSVVIEETFGK